MKRTIALLVMALAMLVGVPALAANYDMSSLKGESGYRISITSAITTSDFIVAPAYGFQRIGFTKGSAFTATAYACENKGYVAAECTSVATLSASTENLEIKTGRPWLVFDVTAAETGANVSYLTIRGHHTSVGGSGGGGGGILGEGSLSAMNASSPSPGDLWLRDDAGAGFNCTSESGGNDVLCMYTDGGVWANAGNAGSGDNLGTGVATTNVNLASNDIINVRRFNEGVYHAEGYASGSTTGGIDEAVSAACASSDARHVVVSKPVSASTTITIDCDHLVLEFASNNALITASAGITAIKVTGDWVQIIRPRIIFAGSNASNVAIDMDNGASTVSEWSIESPKLVGVSDSGIGVRCNGCMKGTILGEGWIRDFAKGIEANTTGGIPPNANSTVGLTLSSNTIGLDITALGSNWTNYGLTAESNPTGVKCVSAGSGTLVDVGGHIEDSSTAAFHRPASGCAFQLFGTRFGSANGDDFLKESSGSAKDVIYGAYFSGAGITNAVGNPVHVYSPANIGTLSCDGTNCVLHTFQNSIVMEGATENAYETTLSFTDPTADRTITFPDADVNLGTMGDITQVAGYASGQAFVEGVASTGSVVLTIEGTTLDANEFAIALQDDDPSADIVWYQPDAASLLLFPTGTRTISASDLTENLSNKTLTTPLVSGTMDMNIGSINDDDCTGDQGEWWYDTTDSAFEWCPANSGTPSVLGGGSSIFDTSGLFAVSNENFIFGGDADNTCEAGEVCTENGVATADSFVARPDDADGGSIVISEGSLDGGQTFTLKVPDAGIGGSNVLCELDSAGKIPATCLVAAVPEVIASGTVALDTDAIASTACDTSDTGITATGVAATDVISWTPNGDISAVTGYAPATTGGLIIYPYPGTNTVSFKVCNPTSSSITPGAVVTLNYQVLR